MGKENRIIPTIWIVSMIALWVLVLFETVLLVLLLRGLGELRQRGGISASDPSQPFANDGLPLGTQAPGFVATDSEGASVHLEDTQGQWRILAFVSPGCPACEQVIQTLNGFREERQDMAVLVIGDTDRQANQQYAAAQQAVMPILTPQANLRREVYRVRGVPFVYLLDETGVLRAKGVVNNREHLDQLLIEAHAPLLPSPAR